MPKYPSQVRYEKAHPAVLVRLSKELKESLDQMKGERSYSDVVREMIQDATQMATEACARFEITIPCVICGKPLTITPSGPIHKEILALQKDEGKLRWQHGDCSK